MKLNILQATVTLGPGRLEAVLSDGRMLYHPDAVAMAELLLAQGVHADGVYMPDWRAGDRAPSAGQKVAIMGRMREHPIFDVAMALKEVTDIAIRVLGTRELTEHWLAQPALALDGPRPLDLLATAPGVEAVKGLLARMEFGVYT